MAKFKVIDKSIVDGKQWYTVLCDREIARWLYERDPVAYRHIATTSTGYIFDIPESTYIFRKIVWSD